MGDGEDDEEDEEDEEECASEEENQVSVLKNCFLAMVDTLSKQVLVTHGENLRPVYLYKIIISVSVIFVPCIHFDVSLCYLAQLCSYFVFIAFI